MPSHLPIGVCRRFAVPLAIVALAISGLAEPVSAATGPYLVADINASGASDPEQLTAVGNTLFFSAKGSGGRELWKSNGQGTVRVKNIGPGSASSWPSDLTDVAGTLFFRAFDGADWGVWKSDGTASGTTLVGHFGTGPITTFAGAAFFKNGDELLRSDGTPLGTETVATIASAPDSYIGELEVVGSRLYISVVEPEGTTDRLYQTNGTLPGTSLVAAIDRFPSSNGIHTLTHVGQRLFFLREEQANVTGPNSAELWTSNGTQSGTRRVYDFVPGDHDLVFKVIGVQGRAFVTANGGFWKSNGFAAGTKPLAPVASFAHPLTNVGGTVYFVGESGLWKSDGTTVGTVAVADGQPYLTPFCRSTRPCDVLRDYDPVGLAGALYFPADRGGGIGVELWRTDGSDDGVEVLGDLRPGFESSKPADLTRVGSALFFSANDGTHGRELWRYVP